MSQQFERLQEFLIQKPRLWLITGVAGFIGSNLLEALLGLNQRVVGIDNFHSGKKNNLIEVQQKVSDLQWSRFNFYEGDIRCLTSCMEVCEGVDHVLHHAALCSVPDSMLDPLNYHEVNMSGFLNLLFAARKTAVSSFVYATSSAVYGNSNELPHMEDNVGQLLSFYALTKYTNELHADFFARTYNSNVIGLRYFNVFGPRQSADGAYAAVIPKWIAAMIQGGEISVYGDGETIRDFCYVDNVIQANLLAAMAKPSMMNQVYNIAVSQKTSLNQLITYLQVLLQKHGVHYVQKPVYYEHRIGDVKYSQADIQRAVRCLDYVPKYGVKEGLEKAMPWYIQNQHNGY